MKISALYADNVIILDGVPRRVAWSAALPDGWSAIQWVGNAGVIEFGTPRKVEKSVNSAIGDLLQKLWASGTEITAQAPPSDVVAQARAQIIDAFIVQAAQDKSAPQSIKDAAEQIGTPDVTIDLSTGAVQVKAP